MASQNVNGRAGFEAESREEARALGRMGFVAFSRAFNATRSDDRQYLYSREVCERFEELCTEMLTLVENGEIEINPAHAQYATARDARNNPAVQALIKTASKKTPIRAKKV